MFSISVNTTSSVTWKYGSDGLNLTVQSLGLSGQKSVFSLPRCLLRENERKYLLKWLDFRPTEGRHLIPGS